MDEVARTSAFSIVGARVLLRPRKAILEMYYAHSSGNKTDRGDWQILADHLIGTAVKAEQYGKSCGLPRAARLAALFHDLGKYDPAFDARLRGENVWVDHSTAGAAVLARLAQGRDRDIAECIGYAILGHHAGLPDKKNETDACMKERLAAFQDRLDPVWQSEITADFAGLLDEFMSKGTTPFDLSVAIRMVFSCLVDADFKDTENFYAALEGRTPDRSWPSLTEKLAQFRTAFDVRMNSFPSDTSLNTMRRDILDHVRGKASLPKGLFTLTVPTGGGKTLASLGFALDHAAIHGASRIIYAIPFTSIIDQTVTIFGGILGDDNVLEHHSAIEDEQLSPIEEEKRNAKGFGTFRGKLRLAMEDWAAPVIVTTNVQLFESLFAARTGRARKLHNIAGSVIILDEAQTIPRPLLMPCVRMLDTLARHYGCTIVLCTATQPALDMRDLKGGLPLEGRELAPDPQALAQKLQRAQIVRGGEMGLDDLVAVMRDHPQALVIVNSRGHALDLWKAAKATGIEGLVHLTTRQYAAHRRRILEEVRMRLKAGLPCRVVATSLIEAGVDVDFPRVWRAEAGLDQIVQAAGRCNREGKSDAKGIVTIFSDPAYATPPEIKGLVGDMKRMWGNHDNLLSLGAIQDYFAEVYWRIGEGLDKKKVLDRLTCSRAGTDFAFRSIAQDFRMIETTMVPVIIARDEKAIKAIEELAFDWITSGKIARALQTYLVQVPEQAREKIRASGKGDFVRPDLREKQFFVLTDGNLYHEETGLWWEDADYLSVEDAMI